MLGESNYEVETTWWEHHYNEPGYIGDYFRKRLRMALAWLEEMDVLKEEIRIFDAGCGGGQLAVAASASGYRVFGMDYSMRMLQNSRALSARKSFCQNRFFQGNVELLPVCDHSVNAVVCLGVISYLKSEEAVLAEFSRILKPGGLLIISATNRARLIKRLDLPLMLLRLQQKVTRRKRQDNGIADKLDDLPQRSYWIPKFRETLRRNGFETQELATFPFDMPTLFGREFLPGKTSQKFAETLEKIEHVPLVESLGSMWMIKARKKLDRI